MNSSSVNAKLVTTSKTESSRHLNDCALIEIIHLHDCLRGALRALQQDVIELSKQAKCVSTLSKICELEKQIEGRFHLIWSVFRAHSAAEDEFIWPLLQQKLNLASSENISNSGISGVCISSRMAKAEKTDKDSPSGSIVVEEYKEDHADEERMFSEMNCLISKLRERLSSEESGEGEGCSSNSTSKGNVNQVYELSRALADLMSVLRGHLLKHLEKEEVQCIPLVRKHLNNEEINDLVGLIMGKRSSSQVSQILTMAVQNLPINRRDEMVQYMKQAMVGTFFERWLSMGGFFQDNVNKDRNTSKNDEYPSVTASRENIRFYLENNTKNITSSSELEGLIRAIAANTELSSEQKSSTVQDLRDAVRESNRKKNKRSLDDMTGQQSQDEFKEGRLTVAKRFEKRLTPPSSYYKLDHKTQKIKLVFIADIANKLPPLMKDVPLFSATELAPTYHDGAANSILGCPHYARSCKLRHPTSGRLHTCRLCCQQERDMLMLRKEAVDSPLDRYSVTEILCMVCGALQPASNKCCNEKCDSYRKLFSKYNCSICNFYDDDPHKSIYHCPFCNVCRTGEGLGIDYRHCMRCNACVSIKDSSEKHVCLPHRLQGNCSICNESMFQSTEPLRGLRCGHVMHFSCFRRYYLRGDPASYTCPLCKKSIEDMKDYFALLDASVRMQPMPETYSDVKSKIYCQDCTQIGNVPYHFIGCKCSFCGSYNTREIQRT